MGKSIKCTQPVSNQEDSNIGKASGKRRLSDLMDVDNSAGKSRHDENDRPVKRPNMTRSKFFDSLPHVTDDLLAGPSSLLSPVPSQKPDSTGADHADLDERYTIAQEDGYLSPTLSFTRFATPDLSSPSRPPKGRRGRDSTEDDNFGAEILSSPAAGLVSRASGIRRNGDRMMATARRNAPERECSDIDNEDQGLDLQGAFCDELTSEIDCSGPENSFTSRTSSSSGPVTPDDSRASPVDLGEGQFSDEVEEAETVYEIKARNVANGWMKRWAYEGKGVSI
jgi:hypothetical protein